MVEFNLRAGALALGVVVQFIAALGSPAIAAAQTEGQKAAARERTLRETPLKIGHDCTPKSVATKLYLKTLNDKQIKHFWLGQRYAVERSFQQEIQRQRLERINEAADAQIDSVENARRASIHSELGIPPIQQYQPSAESKRRTDDAVRQLAEMTAKIADSQYRWYETCAKYTEERSR